MSRRVAGAPVEAWCVSAVREVERRVARWRDLWGRIPRLTQIELPSPAPTVEPIRNPLSRREWDVARLTAQGYTNREIADELVLTTGTVANHVAHILTKLDLASRTRVAVWLVRRQGNIPD